MGIDVACPACDHTFKVHGEEGGRIMPGQEVVKCYECNTLFNPDHNRVAV